MTTRHRAPVSSVGMDPNVLHVAATISHGGSFHLDVEFGVEGGRTLGIAGDIGAGKSSVLNLIAGRLRAVAGTVRGAGELWDDPANGIFVEPRPVAMARQSFRDQLDEDRTGVENVIDAAQALAPDRTDHEPAARSVLSDLGVEPHVVDRLPWTFSGAEAQRVALAAALAAAEMASGPSVLLIDEPFGALDRITKAKVASFLRQWLDAYRGVAVIASGDGELLAQLTTDTVELRPR